MKTRRFSSSATSPGIAIGRCHRIHVAGSAFARTWIKDFDIDSEVARFRKAVLKSKEQIDRIQAKMCRFQGHDQIKIIESHRMFLQDDMLVAAAIDHIQRSKINAEWALDKTLAHLKLSFLNVNEDYFRERLQDVDYVGRRVMDNLMGSQMLPISELPEGNNLVLIAHDISPAEVASLPKDRVRGFAMEAGGETSHSAIISRALEIPAIFGVKGIFSEIEDGETIILDGMKGLIITSPSKKELDQYRAIESRYIALEKMLMQDIHLPAVTKDGFKMKIEANMELTEEIPSIIQHGAEGIGLYRTEYLFLNKLEEPSEEEQFEDYVKVLEKLAPKPVTIRTIDLGGDKLPISETYEGQTNPALGLRAIRLCLKERGIFKTQLRALFRASMHGNLKILIPMVSGCEEITETKRIIKEVRDELAGRGVRMKKNVPVGVMVEVPSAVFMADELAREVDFFSIGTNDLIQYGLAIDRVNEHVSHLYNPFHPAILRMIHKTVKAAKNAGIETALCGELAGNPMAIALMVGLELDMLSMNPVSIPRVKKILRAITKKESVKLLKTALTLTTAADVEELLKSGTQHILPGDVKRLHILEETEHSKN